MARSTETTTPATVQNVSVRFPRETHEDLTLVAQIDGMSATQIIIDAVDGYVRERLKDQDFVDKLEAVTRRQQEIVKRARGAKASVA